MHHLLIILYTIAFIFAVIGMIAALFSGNLTVALGGLIINGLLAALYGSTVHYLKACNK